MSDTSLLVESREVHPIWRFSSYPLRSSLTSSSFFSKIMLLEENLEGLSAELSTLERIMDGLAGKTRNPQNNSWLQDIKKIESNKDDVQDTVYLLRSYYPSNSLNGRAECHMKLTTVLNMKVIKDLEAVKPLKGKAFEVFMHNITGGRLKRFSHKDLIMYTSEPSNEIGSGRFAKVYKGQLSDGVQVAIKVLIQKDVTQKDIIKDIFVSEVSTMLKASHPNLIKLYGFCFDRKMKAFVYEHMDNGSLDKVLSKNHHKVKWQTLYAIALEVAKVLAYLHHGCEKEIVHYDVKPSNVLLDSKLSAKLTDCGSPRVVVNKGMSGYVAPEMLTCESKVSYTCDVYSFGMILFDILVSTRNTQSRTGLPKEVWDKLNKGELDELIMEYGIVENNREKAKILSILALWCVQFTPGIRPSMTLVADTLEKVLQVTMPPDPSLPCNSSISMQQSRETLHAVVPLTNNESPSQNIHQQGDQNFDTNFPVLAKSNQNELKVPVETLLRGPLKRFLLRNLKRYTANFSTRVTSDGFADVYKGVFSNGMQVVVKVLEVEEIHIDEETFIKEVSTMAMAHHRNLVKPLGYCFEINMKALVFAYMSNGSLDKILFEKRHKNIEWEKLYRIVIETAKGLSYLHDGCDRQIFHLDVKASNVLLDSHLSPKVTNFGMSRLIKRDVLQLAMKKRRGDPSSPAPEMMQSSYVTSKCDVYSFGMMLFEVLGRRRNIVGKTYFPKILWTKFEKGEVEEIIVECGITAKNRENAMILCLVAFWCIQYTPENRPSMETVIKMLEKDIKVLMPPNPFLPTVANSMNSYHKVGYHWLDFEHPTF